MGDHRLIVLYDGHCVLCTKTVSRLMNLRTTLPIQSIPIQDERAAAWLPAGYNLDQLNKEIHVIDCLSQVVFRGPEAIVYVMTKLPSLRYVSFIYRVPGMKGLASLLYRWIAKHRYDLFGRTEDCQSGQCRFHDRHTP